VHHSFHVLSPILDFVHLATWMAEDSIRVQVVVYPSKGWVPRS